MEPHTAGGAAALMSGSADSDGICSGLLESHLYHLKSGL